MLTKSTIHSVSVAIGALLLATGSMICYGESQSEWLQKQLQITDGYVPAASPSMPGNVATLSPYEGTSVTVLAGTADRATKDEAGKPPARDDKQFRGGERIFPSDGM